MGGILCYVATMALFVAALAVGGAARMRATRRRLSELDMGTRCVACDGVDMERTHETTRCRTCGHTSSIAAMRAAHVTAREAETLVEVDRRGE